MTDPPYVASCVTLNNRQKRDVDGLTDQGIQMGQRVWTACESLNQHWYVVDFACRDETAPSSSRRGSTEDVYHFRVQTYPRSKAEKMKIRS